jgi:hypothetical protein
MPQLKLRGLGFPVVHVSAEPVINELSAAVAVVRAALQAIAALGARLHLPRAACRDARCPGGPGTQVCSYAGTST